MQTAPRVKQAIGLWVWMNVLLDTPYADILENLAGLSRELEPELIGGESLRIQLHLGPEARKKGRAYATLSDRPVFLDELLTGIREGRYPKVSVLNMPFWGMGRELGVILNPNAAVTKAGEAEMREVVETAEQIAEETEEDVSIIICPGKDEFRSNAVDFEDAWRRFDDFLLPVAASTALTFLLEWQTRQEGFIGVFPTPEMAIEWTTRFNDKAGRKAMNILPHFAQSLALGVPIANTLEKFIDAGLFAGWLHVNGGARSPVNLTDPVHLVREGKLLASDIPFAAVTDVAPGVVGPRNLDLVEEQRAAMKVAAKWLRDNPSETLYLGQCWKAWTSDPFGEVRGAVLLMDRILREALEGRA